VAGYHCNAAPWAKACGYKRSHAAYEPIYYRRHPVKRAAYERARHRRHIEPAKLAEYIERILLIRLVHGNTARYCAALSHKPGVAEPRAATNGFINRSIRKHGRHGGCGCGVAYAHFARNYQLIALLFQLPYGIYSRLYCPHSLLRRHCRAKGKIHCSVCNVPVRNAVCPCKHTHVNGIYLCAYRARHCAHGAFAVRGIRGNYRRYLAAGLRDPFRHHAVIRAEHCNAAPRYIHICAARERRRLYHHFFQLTKAAQRLCNAVPTALCQCRRVNVRIRYG